MLDAFASRAALVGPTAAAAALLTQRAANMSAAAQVRAVLAPASQSAAVKSTSRAPGPPKAKHVHTLVLESWSLRDDPAFFAHTFWELARRPVLASPLVALKVLLVVHKLCQQGSPETLVALTQHGSHLLDGLKAAWPATKRAPEPEQQELVGLIAPYAQLLKLKSGASPPLLAPHSTRFCSPVASFLSRPPPNRVPRALQGL